MTRDIITKVLIPVAAGSVLYYAIPPLVRWLWPVRLSISANMVADPLAYLPLIIVLFVVYRMVWKRRGDGTYFDTKFARWATAGMLLLVVASLLLLLVGKLFEEFLIPSGPPFVP